MLWCFGHERLECLADQRRLFGHLDPPEMKQRSSMLVAEAKRKNAMCSAHGPCGGL
jgi:hypothetical protein